jgi:hypothetical protein
MLFDKRGESNEHASTAAFKARQTQAERQARCPRHRVILRADAGKSAAATAERRRAPTGTAGTSPLFDCVRCASAGIHIGVIATS